MLQVKLGVKCRAFGTVFEQGATKEPELWKRM
jgi:hypothetical protein